MNKIYDKLFLAIAVLVLLAGVGFYVTQSGAGHSNPTSSANLATTHKYAAVPVPSSSSQEASWPGVEAQSAGPLWIYDVFTPPKIYIDKNGEFVAEPPNVVIEQAIPFDIYLGSIDRNLYRLQFEGYIEEDPTDASKSLVLLFNEETGKSVRARVGVEKKAAEFELVEFTIERVSAPDGSITKRPEATILDKRTGETKILTRGVPLYDDGVTVVLRSEADASLSLEFTNEGETFETPLGQYTLEKIDLDRNSVTVKKHATEEREEEVLELTPQAAVEESKVVETEPAVETSTFDSLF